MKYRFEIFFANKYLQKLSELMSQLDLGIDGMAIQEIMIFDSHKELDIPEVKKVIIFSYEHSDCKVLKIEVEKVE